MADVKWIKITTDVFNDEKILLIESLPDSNAIIVVWFKLLCLAGKQNNSGVFMLGKIAYTEEMLATIFRMNVNTVKLALQTFEQFGMVEIIDGVITIPNWGKHQNLEQIEARKEYQREYQREYRRKQKLIATSDEDKHLRKHLREDYVNSLEEDKEKEIDKEVYINIVEYLNQKTGAKYKSSSKKTKTLIHARLSEGFTLDDFKTVIDKKCTDWLGDEKMQQYLRPETLFGTKFESYLNAKVTKKPVNTGMSETDADSLDDLF